MQTKIDAKVNAKLNAKVRARQDRTKQNKQHRPYKHIDDI